MLVRREKTEYRKKLNKIKDFLYVKYSKEGESIDVQYLIDKITKECKLHGME